MQKTKLFVMFYRLIMLTFNLKIIQYPPWHVIEDPLHLQHNLLNRLIAIQKYLTFVLGLEFKVETCSFGLKNLKVPNI